MSVLPWAAAGITAVAAVAARWSPTRAAQLIAMWGSLAALAAAVPLPWWGGVDELSSLLIPFTALIGAAAFVALPRGYKRRDSIAAILMVEALTLAMFACEAPEAVAALWVAGLVPFALKMRSRMAWGYLGAAAALMAASRVAPQGVWSAGLLLGAVLIREGVAPLHSWMPEAFARAPLPATLLFCGPQAGVYAAARLLAPTAPAEVLDVMAAAALATAVYGAGLALVQREARRALGWLVVSQSAIVLAGLQCGSEAELTGSLVLWLSGSAALTGFGMTLCLLEARRGQVALDRHQGGYDRMPGLAGGFLVLGLCAVGFPGTLGFVGAELLVDGVVGTRPLAGVAVVVATVLNGINVVRMFFLLFCGAKSERSVSMQLRPHERMAIASLVLVTLLAGLWPGPTLRSRTRAAERILSTRSR